MSSKLVGQDKLIRRLKAIEDGRPVLRTIQLRAVAEAKKRVARKTSHTARTIMPGALTDSFTIVTASGAAPYLEFGTGKYGPKRKTYVIKAKPGKMLAFPAKGTKTRLSGRLRSSEIDKDTGRAKKGRLVFRHQVTHPGIKPQPFLVPAAKFALRTAGIEAIIVEWNRAA
jgi:hypothetical protein